MSELINGICLYHGSYCEVMMPDISKCARYKDFGQGFYLTTSREQARSFAKISTGKAKQRGLIREQQRFGIVNAYTFIDSGDLRIFYHPTADIEWLHCVIGHRRNRYFPDAVKKMRNYDVISGKVANDDTNVTITAYLDGIYGEIGTERADQFCISLLLPERLKDQFCFRTEKALKTLKFEGSERVWL